MHTIIHIGQHKTATTSIQQYLQDNRDTLLQSGLYVPTSIAGYNEPSHFILNVYALAEGRFSSRKEAVLAERGKQYLKDLEQVLREDIEKIYEEASRRGCSRVIWSNEGLYLLNTTAEYKRLFDLFSSHSAEVEVVCCFRDAESYRASYIQQLLKQNITLSSNPDSYRYLEPDSWLFDYDRKKTLLAEAFDKCTCFSYDPDNNVKAFLKAIGIDAKDAGNYRLNITGNTQP